MNYIHNGLSGVTLNASGDALITGQVDPWDMGHSAEIYHADTGTFTMAGDMVHTRQNHRSAISNDHSKVLVVGGFYEYLDSNNFLFTAGTPNAEVYDVASNTFTEIGPLNYDRYGETLTALDDGSFLVVGGSSASNNAEIYKP